MNAIGKTRLRRLARKLKTVPRATFNMMAYTTGICGGKRLGECGTTGCAAGWGVTLPSLRRAGLTTRALHRAGRVEEMLGRVFDLTASEVKNILYSFDDCTPKQKARQIEKLVAAS